jgi:hypothetical protein
MQPRRVDSEGNSNTQTKKRTKQNVHTSVGRTSILFKKTEQAKNGLTYEDVHVDDNELCHIFKIRSCHSP